MLRRARERFVVLELPQSIAPAAPLRDFDDQFAELLSARSVRMGGDPQGALARLVKLRGDVLDTVEPKSRGLVSKIDSEIGAAISVALAAPRQAVGQRPRTVGALLRRFELALLRIAVSVIFFVDLSHFVVGKL
jgi:hypothetical protein